MAMLYGTTLDYLLDQVTLDHVLMLYEYAMEWHGADLDKYKPEPDRAAFRARYGGQIKGPEPEGVS